MSSQLASKFKQPKRYFSWGTDEAGKCMKMWAEPAQSVAHMGCDGEREGVVK